MLTKHSFSSSDIVPIKCLSLMSCRICGPSNTPAFNFSKDWLGHAVMRYLKQSPSVVKALINCFIRPSFMCRGGNIMFFRSTSGSCRMLGSQGVRAGRGGQLLSTQCFECALLSHMHR